MKYTLSVLVENESGVLTRIAGLFARRGFNIESLAVGPTEKKEVSRIIMVLAAGNETIQQLIQQLYKLINVLVVKDITMSPTVERELMLIKIQTNLKTRSQIVEIANIFRAKIVDLADNSITLEVTGDPGKIVALEKLVEKYKIIEIARTGKISLLRESKVNSEYLKNYSI